MSYSDARKMRVSEMFIACKTKREDGSFTDVDVDIVPFDEEYSDISLQNIEESIKVNGTLNLEKNEVEVSIEEAKQVVVDLKEVLKNRVVLSGIKKGVIND